MKLNPMHYIRLWREPWRKVFWRSFYAWRKDKGEEKRFSLPFLTADDVLFDFGGYQGNWAARMIEEHGTKVHIFEAHPTFAEKIADRFKDDPRATVHPIALGRQDGRLNLSDDADASSVFLEGSVKGRVQKAGIFLSALNPPVALAKINIEGGEYDLLPALDEADWLKHIRVLQIQFHLYGPDDIERRDAIRKTLSKTHTCDWDYPFVWEQWSLR